MKVAEGSPHSGVRSYVGIHGLRMILVTVVGREKWGGHPFSVKVAAHPYRPAIRWCQQGSSWVLNPVKEWEPCEGQ